MTKDVVVKEGTTVRTIMAVLAFSDEGRGLRGEDRGYVNNDPVEADGSMVLRNGDKVEVKGRYFAD